MAAAPTTFGNPGRGGSAGNAPVALGALGPEERMRLGGAGLRTFFNIADRWGLSVEDQGRLLGDLGRTTVYEWRRGAPGAPSAYSTDLLTRLSCLIGIYGTLQRLYGRSPEFAHAWVTAPNRAPAYAGRSPLQLMLEQGMQGLLLVRRLLEAESGGGLTDGVPIPWERSSTTEVATAAMEAARTLAAGMGAGIPVEDGVEPA